METAIYSLIGIAIGAILQYVFTRHHESLKYYREIRTKAYTDFLKCVAERAADGAAGPSNDLKSRIADSKLRICVHGSSRVIKTFAEFERLGAKTETPDQRDIFTEMAATMRFDSSTHGGIVEKQDLEVIIFGKPRA